MTDLEALARVEGAKDVAAIAAGLTKAQREGVISGRYDDDSSLRGRQRTMFYALTERGLFTSNNQSRYGDFHLTPLGIALRAHLTAGATHDR
jgi:hypothetical protein